MKNCVVKKLTIVNSFVLYTFHRNITHSRIIICKTIEKMESLKCVCVCVRGGGGGGGWKRAIIF